MKIAKLLALAIVAVIAVALLPGPARGAVEDDPLVIPVKPAKLTPLKKEAVARIEASASELDKLNDTVWAAAEVALEEYASSDALASYLERNGFRVERGVAGLPTSFVGLFGSGEPVIGFLAEYDALPGLSQQAVSVKKPVVPGGPGHGCGHNVFGTATVAEVSWLTPTTSLSIASKPLGTPGHHWSMTACGGMSIGHKALRKAAEVMSASCLDLLAQPQTIAAMREEWKKDTKGREYKSPLPPDLQPRVVPRRPAAAGEGGPR